MSTLDQLLHDYSAIHRHPVNQALHAIGIPLILASGAGLLQALPAVTLLGQPLAPIWLATALLVREMGRWSWPIAGGIAAWLLAAAALAEWALHVGVTPGGLAAVSGAGFVAAWVLQFLGHAFERASPAFIRRPEFLAAGPLSLAAALYRRLGIPI
ncbi:MAG: Mpo1-like protein [Nevskiales bacterium]